MGRKKRKKEPTGGLGIGLTFLYTLSFCSSCLRERSKNVYIQYGGCTYMFIHTLYIYQVEFKDGEREGGWKCINVRGVKLGERWRSWS